MHIHNYIPVFDYSICYTIDDENWKCAETNDSEELVEFSLKLIRENRENENFSYFLRRANYISL